MTPPTDSRRRGLPALVCALAVLGVRLVVVLARQDTWYPFEVQSGSIASALLDGIALDLPHLPIVPHARGSALFGVLLVPLYAVGGASSLTMKLLPVLWHAATVALLAWLLERHATRRAAWCAGLLFLAAPPMLQKLSTLGLASHLESSLPMFATWGAWLAWSRDGATRGRALRLGAAAGFSAFFHLQALLPALLVLGLLALRERRALLAANGAWLAVGFAVCAAPSFLFESGAVELLLAGVFTTDVTPEAATGPGPLDKALGLVGGDLAAALEFGGTAAPLGGWLAGLAVLALGLGTLAGLASLRRAPRTGLLFALHALLVGGLYAVSNLEVEAVDGAGATNRHLAPMLVSLLVLTALGAARGRWTLAPVVLLVAVGCAGFPAVVRTSEAARARQRGDCYEWFTRHLELDAGGDARAWAELVERVDRGDARFRPLRFAFAPADAGALADEALASDVAPALPVEGAGALMVWCGLGRRLGARRDELVTAASAGRPRAPAPDARASFFRGVGLGQQPPRGKAGPARVDAWVEELRGWLARLPEDDAVALAEGYGFQLGFAFDPYNTNMADVLRRHLLEGEPGAAFARGLAWGARQRFPAPPDAVPDGLVLAGCVDPRFSAAFADAWCGRVLPR